MAFGGFSNSGSAAPMAEINMVPLIDVMLVMLVIFIITAPLLTHSVKIELPKASSSPNLTRPDHIALSINSAGVLYWNGAMIEKSQLAPRFAAAAKIDPQPELHLHADKTTQYQILAEIMADAGKAGITRIGFVSDPSEQRH
jgi:biopolymer transport protein ExbD